MMRPAFPLGGDPMGLLLAAALGFIVPNSFLLYWLVTEYQGLSSIVQDRLALAFILDVAAALAVLAVYFAKHPIGPVGWQWFVALSLAGGLGFSLPLYYWLNQRQWALVSAQAAAGVV
jgi:hypothetical protein